LPSQPKWLLTPFPVLPQFSSGILPAAPARVAPGIPPLDVWVGASSGFLYCSTFCHLLSSRAAALPFACSPARGRWAAKRGPTAFGFAAWEISSAFSSLLPTASRLTSLACFRRFVPKSFGCHPGTAAINMGDRPDRPGLRLAGLTLVVQSVRLSAALILLGTLGNGDHHTYFLAATGTPSFTLVASRSSTLLPTVTYSSLRHCFTSFCKLPSLLERPNHLRLLCVPIPHVPIPHTTDKLLQNSQQFGRTPRTGVKNLYRHNSAKNATSIRPVTLLLRPAPLPVALSHRPLTYDQLPDLLPIQPSLSERSNHLRLLCVPVNRSSPAYRDHRSICGCCVYLSVFHSFSVYGSVKTSTMARKQ
jgi:hypothetical protein